MAAAMLRVWESQGRPWRLCTPLLDMVGRLKGAYPRLVYGTLGDDAHLNAVPPEDHTPFSATGYPKTSPYPVVHALDVMHHPESGVDAGKLFTYWLGEAKAGRMPWLKYLIWQATIYDVRYGWRPQSSSGHFDHVHLSSRTDAEDTHLGAWSPIPPAPEQEDDMRMIRDNKTTSIYLMDGTDSTGKPVLVPISLMDQVNAYKAAGVPYAEVAAVNWDYYAKGPLATAPGTGPSAAEIATAVVDEEHDRLAD